MGPVLLLAALAASPSAAGRPAVLKVAVVPLRAPAKLTYTGKSASLSIAAEARKMGHEVVGPEELERRLGRAASLGLVDCGGAPRCLAERAKALQVDRVVGGTLSQAEDRYRVSVVHVDARSGEIVASFDREVPVASRRLGAEVATATPPLLRGEADRPGVLEVTSDPPGAEVEIDGTPAGTTPLRRELRPGKHQVRLRLAGYLDQAPAWVEVTAAGVTPHRVRLHRPPGGR